VHLKDVDLRLAERVRAGRTTFVDAVRQGLFRPLGQGGLPIAEVVLALEEAGYRGWYVLEQDTALDAEPGPGEGPVVDVRSSLIYLLEVAARLPHQSAAARGDGSARAGFA
jgi:inosose dehydratase